MENYFYKIWMEQETLENKVHIVAWEELKKTDIGPFLAEPPALINNKKYKVETVDFEETLKRGK